MKRLILNIALVLSMGFFSPLVTQPAYAACSSNNPSKNQVLQGVGDTGGNCSGQGVTDFLNTIVKILSIIAGIAGIIMVIVGGLKYITSGGDSNKVSSAKTTLIYALIGLAIAALAQFLVHFVLTASAKSIK